MPPLIFNGVTIPDNSANALSFNGSDVTQVVFNGTTVWQQSLGASYDLGLTPILDSVSGIKDAWAQRTVDVSGYAGATVRPVFRYLNGGGYRGDIQLDQIVIGGTTSSFESSADSYERNPNTSQPSDYASVVWEPVSTSGSNGEWARDSGGTPSANTGNPDAAAGSFYLYAETSNASLSNNAYFWLRGPAVTLDSSNPVFTYYEARNGLNMGTLDVYLDVIS